MNHYEDLKRRVLVNPTAEMKRKVIKRIKRDIMKLDPEVKMSYMSAGVKDGKVIIVIDTDYGYALMIKNALNNHKIVKAFDVVFAPNSSFPEGTQIEKI